MLPPPEEGGEGCGTGVGGGDGGRGEIDPAALPDSAATILANRFPTASGSDSDTHYLSNAKIEVTCTSVPFSSCTPSIYVAALFAALMMGIVGRPVLIDNFKNQS